MELERIGTLKDGKTGKVYLCRDRENHQLLIEKRLLGDGAVYDRLRELRHPYLPAIYQVSHEEGWTVVREEYIEGADLSQITLSQRQLTRLLLELCDVLAYLHQNNILHRDIKPSNLMLAGDGHLRLIDFGAAREEKPDAERDTRLLGTRGYAPPEQYGFAQTDARTDIYALGVTFRQLLGPLARKRRWKGLLRKCTALDPNDRYRSTAQIKRAVYRGRLWRWLVRPVSIAAVVLAAAFLTWSYTTDVDFHTAMDIVLRPRRDIIFDTVDMDAVKSSDVQLQRYTGDEREVYLQLIAACPEGNFISTGCADENGNLLFGSFRVRYDISTGERYYTSFDGLCRLTADQEVCFIPAEDCGAYAPAVLTLYRLEVFDTPIF